MEPVPFVVRRARAPSAAAPVQPVVVRDSLRDPAAAVGICCGVLAAPSHAPWAVAQNSGGSGGMLPDRTGDLAARLAAAALLHAWLEFRAQAHRPADASP